MSIITAVLVVAGALSSPAAATAQEEKPTAEFLALETKLMGAAQNKNQAEIEALVSPDFAYNLALEGRSNYVLNRSEWLKGSSYYNLDDFQISRLTAHVFGKTAVTSFKLVVSAQPGTKMDMSGSYVVTDLWTSQSQGKWTLRRRFVSRPVVIPASQ